MSQTTAALQKYSSLEDSVEQHLNEQLSWEAHCSSTYLGMSEWCKRQGYDETADFFSAQAADERAQAVKVLDYMTKRGGCAKVPEIVDIVVDRNSLCSVFEQVLEIEMRATLKLQNIADQCVNLKDYLTFQFIQSLLHDQLGKEHVARRILSLIIEVGEDSNGRSRIDSQVLEISWGLV